jgi:hypothetical protein
MILETGILLALALARTESSSFQIKAHGWHIALQEYSIIV